jgi:2-alkyl-3-oxoalkanoate reductase
MVVAPRLAAAPVLVTGATGFIGRRLVARLHAMGESVRALALPGESTDQIPELAGAEIVRGNVTDPAALGRAVRGAQRVYHLAAIVGDWGDDATFEAVNVGGTRNLCAAARDADVERLVMVSSVVVYGWRLHTSICDEASPAGVPSGPYSRTKRRSEEIALEHQARGELEVVVVRPGNVYGAGSRNWVNEIARLARRRRLVVIDGGSGDAGIVYVDNVVDVIVRAGQVAAARGRIYNAQDGQGVSWRRYLGDIASLVGAPPPRLSIPHPVALGIAHAMERAWKLGRARSRPLLTREAVTLLSQRAPVPIERARRELGYDVPVKYEQALELLRRELGSSLESTA